MKELISGILSSSLISTVFIQEYPDLGVKVEIVAENLIIPCSID
ncbi:MAG: hypothetical protein ACRBB5_03510 [Nitrosopumilus sp.]